MPEGSFRHDHLVGKDGALVKDTISIGVFKHSDKSRPLLQQFGFLQILSIAFGDEHASLRVEGGEHRMFDKRRGGRQLDGESVIDDQLRLLERFFLAAGQGAAKGDRQDEEVWFHRAEESCLPRPPPP